MLCWAKLVFQATNVFKKLRPFNLAAELIAVHLSGCIASDRDAGFFSICNQGLNLNIYTLPATMYLYTVFKYNLVEQRC